MNKNSAKINLIRILIIACVIGLIILIIHNLNSDDFLKASLFDIISITVSSVILFIIAKMFDENIKKQEKIISMISRLQNDIVFKDDLYIINDRTLQLYSSCDNRIKYLKDYSDINAIRKELEFINSHFMEIRQLYSNHNTSNSELQSVMKDINRHRMLIDDKCEKIIIMLM